jgi:hypothetical protein
MAPNINPKRDPDAKLQNPGTTTFTRLSSKNAGFSAHYSIRMFNESAARLPASPKKI